MSTRLARGRRAAATSGTRPVRSEPSAPWLAIREKGSALGIRFLVVLATAFGRRLPRLVLHVPVAYFVAFHRGIREASRDYLRRIGVAAPSMRDVYAQVLRFARVTLDRVFILRGRHDLFETCYSGHEHLAMLHRERRGALLISAHLGSSAAMSLGGRAERMKINIAGHFRNAALINDILRQLDPSASTRVIELDRSNVGAVLAIRKRIAAGEIVALTGDRYGINDRTVCATFLGGRALFPAAPYILASILKCPVYLVFALYREPNRYELFCEPFAARITLPRQHREQALEALASQYAARLEHYCRLAPDNWFNFYRFWMED